MFPRFWRLWRRSVKIRWRAKLRPKLRVMTTLVLLTMVPASLDPANTDSGGSNNQAAWRDDGYHRQAGSVHCNNPSEGSTTLTYSLTALSKLSDE